MIGFGNNYKNFQFGSKIEIGYVRNVTVSFLQDMYEIGYLNYISNKTEEKLNTVINGTSNIDRTINRNEGHLLLNISLLKKRVKWTVKKLYGSNVSNVKFISSIKEFKFIGHLMYYTYCVDRYIWFILLTEDDQYQLLQKANKSWLDMKAKGNDPAKPSSLYGTAYVYVFGDGQGSSNINPPSEIFKSYSEKFKIDLNLNLDFKKRT